MAAHLPQLAVALIPADLAQFSSPSELWPVSFILRDFHLGMARWLAERLRPREQIVGTALAANRSQIPQDAAAECGGAPSSGALAGRASGTGLGRTRRRGLSAV